MDKAIAKLKPTSPDLRIVGTHHGYFDKTPGSAGNEAVIEQMAQHSHRRLRDAPARARADGELAPSYRRRIDADVALTYVSGELQRAPRCMTRRPAPTAWSGWAGSSSHPAALP